MKAIILGAGQVGCQLARVLSERRNDVIVIDTDSSLLDHLKDQLDILTVCGNGASSRTLVRAGIEDADLFFAVTSNSEANILACTVAKRFSVPKKIARVRSSEFFDEAAGLDRAFFGIDHTIIPEYECASNIVDALLRPAVKETVKFSLADAQMVNFQLPPGSPMVGERLRDFPRKDLIQQSRICAILRHGNLIIPRGDSTFLAFDEVYVAGAQNVIDEMISWADPERPMISKVIIAGGSEVGRTLAAMLATFDMQVCLIEPDQVAAEAVASSLGSNALIIHGESNDKSVLEEAGIRSCDAFVATHRDNENNILACLMAKRLGAGKVIAVTNHPDYIPIIAGMTLIDCGFSPLVSAINILIQHISSEYRRTVALLKRANAEVMEMLVVPNSLVDGKKILDLKIPKNVVFAMIQRDGLVVPAIGEQVLRQGDRVVVLAASEARDDLEDLFSPGRLLG